MSAIPADVRKGEFATCYVVFSPQHNWVTPERNPLTFCRRRKTRLNQCLSPRISRQGPTIPKTSQTLVRAPLLGAE